MEQERLLEAFGTLMYLKGVYRGLFEQATYPQEMISASWEGEGERNSRVTAWNQLIATFSDDENVNRMVAAVINDVDDNIGRTRTHS